MSKQSDKNAASPKARKIEDVTVLCDIPAGLPVTEEELAILDCYFSDIISAAINDNDC